MPDQQRTTTELTTTSPAKRWDVRHDIKQALLLRSAAFGMGHMGPGKEYQEQLDAFERGEGPPPNAQLSMAAAKACDAALRNHLMAESQNQRDQFYGLQQKLADAERSEFGAPLQAPEKVREIILAVIQVEREKTHRKLERGEIEAPRRLKPSEQPQIIDAPAIQPPETSQPSPSAPPSYPAYPSGGNGNGHKREPFEDRDYYDGLDELIDGDE